jgi:hypothetical protein
MNIETKELATLWTRLWTHFKGTDCPKYLQMIYNHLPSQRFIQTYFALKILCKIQ